MVDQQASIKKERIDLYIVQKCLPYVFNILDLVFIDMEDSNLVLALKLILKIVDNWDIPA